MPEDSETLTRLSATATATLEQLAEPARASDITADAETPDAETLADAEQIAAARSAQQFNEHDAKTLAKQVDQLLLALAQMGLAVDQGRIKAAAEAQAACEILVAHGLVTEAEVQARVYLTARAILASALQQAEEARLTQQQQARGVQAVRKPPLVIARH